MFELFAQLFGPEFRNSPVLGELRTWVEHIAQHAPQKWLPIALSGARCECQRPAMGVCAICKRVTCLGHAMVNATAEIVCFDCVKNASAAPRQRSVEAPRWEPQGAPGPRVVRPPVDERTKRLKTLGLRGDASMEEIRAAWKRLALKHHPDRAPERKRETAEKRMREINEAYQWLLSHAEAA